MPLPDNLISDKKTVQIMLDNVHISPPNLADLQNIKMKWAEHWPNLLKSANLVALEKRLLSSTIRRQYLANPKRSVSDYRFDGPNRLFWKAVSNTELETFKTFHSLGIKGVPALVEVKKHESDPDKSWLVVESGFPKFSGEFPDATGVIAKIAMHQVNFDPEIMAEEAENEQMGSSYFELQFAYDEVIRSVPRKPAKSSAVQGLDGPAKQPPKTEGPVLLDIALSTTIRSTWNPTRRRFGEITTHLVGGTTTEPSALKSAQSILELLKELKTNIAASSADKFPANTGFSLVLIGNPELADWSLVLTDPHELPQSLRFPNTSEAQGPRSSRHNLFKAIDRLSNHLVSLGGADFISLKKYIPEIAKIK